MEASGSVRAGGEVGLEDGDEAGRHESTDDVEAGAEEEERRRGAASACAGARRKAKVHVELTDAAGNTAEADLKVKLKGAKRKK